MTIQVIEAGLQTTIQAGPRTGLRHLGVPTSGAADSLSLALANRLVGNDLHAAALEVTLSGLLLRFDGATYFALTGAVALAEINGQAIPVHETVMAVSGDELHVAVSDAGARVYVAFAGGLVADDVLGSTSTYLPAGFGGYQGRALLKDDRLHTRPVSRQPELLQTPEDYQPLISRTWALRACHAPETSLLADPSRVFEASLTVGNRADRMGMILEGEKIDVLSEGRMRSAPVFPGTIQCPEDGQLFVLAVDAQTTGGYPRVGQIARVDRHLLGQIRVGDKLRLLWRDEQSAIDDLRAKVDYWQAWLPGVASVI